MNRIDASKILDNFILESKRNISIGSGDDLYYANQIEEYINQQRGFWTEAILTFMDMGRENLIKEQKDVGRDLNE